MLLHILFFYCQSFQMNASIDLQGLPLQIEWHDLNSDGLLDLTVVVIKTETVGNFSTFYQEGSLRGVYEDTTSQSFFLRTWLKGPEGFKEAPARPLENGFVAFILKGNDLFLWQNENHLEVLNFGAGEWQSTRVVSTSVTHAYNGNEFNFIWSVNGRNFWMLPDLSGLTLLDCEQPMMQYLPFFDSMIRNQGQEGTGQVFQVPLPVAMDVTGDGRDDLVFTMGDQRWIWHADEEPDERTEPIKLSFFPADLKGMLVDLDGDKKHELISIEAEDDDIEKLKDLKKIKSKISVYRADQPLNFGTKPSIEQSLQGFFVPEGEDDFFLLNPFQDINSDGLMDMASFGFKLSYLQVARVATTGKMKVTFLLELHIQQPNGRFKTLPGGPFEMSWTLDLRKLRMPEFGQLTADFNADGWIDMMTVSEKKVSLNLLSAKGYGDKPLSVKFPGSFLEPDQVFGRDLNADSLAEIILMKITGNSGHLAILEARP